MRHSGILERDRTQNRFPLLLIALQANRFPPSDQVRGHALPENAVMRLVVISIGRLKQGPERELAERYRERFDDIGRKLGFRGLEIHEIPESRARDAATRIAEEAAAISAAIPEKSVLVALDEPGKSVDSATFPQQLGPSRPERHPNPIFTIRGS